MRFVEIVDAPDHAAFGVAPGAEILDMQIADREELRRIGELRTGLAIKRHPAIESPAQERERGLAHFAMLQREIGFDQLDPRAGPALIGGGFGNDAHGAAPVGCAARAGSG